MTDSNYKFTPDDIKQMKKWVKVLRSGKYKQTKGSLQTGDGFCCLGVACKELISKEKLKYDELDELDGDLPDSQTSAPRWLKNVNETISPSSEYIDNRFFLSDLNDDHSFKFDDLANVIELGLIHGNLDKMDEYILQVLVEKELKSKGINL